MFFYMNSKILLTGYIKPMSRGRNASNHLLQFYRPLIGTKPIPIIPIARSGQQLLHRFPFLLKISNIPNSKDDHDRNHKQSIKDIEECFVGYQVPAVALEIFDDAENTSDKYQRASSIEDIDMAFPTNNSSHCSWCRIVDKFIVKCNCCNYKEAKEGNLHE